MKQLEIIQMLKNGGILIYTEYRNEAGGHRYKRWQLGQDENNLSTIQLHGLTERGLHRNIQRTRKVFNGVDMPIYEPYYNDGEPYTLKCYYSIKTN